MTIAHPRRLRAQRALPQALREALRELPHAAPEPTQLDDLRQKLGLAAVTLEASVQPLPVPDRRQSERRIRRTVVALVFFPIAAAAAVGTVMVLHQQRARSGAAAANFAAAQARSHGQRPVSHSAPLPVAPAAASAVASGGLGSPAQADSAASLAGLPGGAPSSASSTGHAELRPRPIERKQAVATEVELLQRANAALKGDPAQALSLAAQHRRLFPAGNLAQEREVIAIKALVALADSARAREGLMRFERAYPRSAHVLELRQIVR